MEDLENNMPYLFKVLWSKNCIGIAINEKDSNNTNIPLTGFYFWPREDGWKLLKAELDSKPWMGKNAKKDILNSYTQIVHFWLKNIDQSVSIEGLKKHKLGIHLDILGINTLS